MRLIVPTVVLIYALLVTSVSCDGIDVDLSEYAPTQTFSGFFTLSKTQVKIDMINVARNVGFLIVQAHTFIENITLSQTSKIELPTSVTGRNIGLFVNGGFEEAILYILRSNMIEPTVTVYLVINLYGMSAPLPGGCNLTFNTPVAPYQIISYNDHYVQAHSQAPSGSMSSCDDNLIDVVMYHMYLPQYDNRNTTYFEAIRKMTTVDGILANGRKVPDQEGRFKYGRLYSNYIGTGEVFAVIATYNNLSSAYVPAVSYGCDTTNWDTDCIGPVSVHWKIYCATMIFVGAFVCLFGHRFFRTTLFLMALKFGLIVTFALISLEPSFTTFEKAITSFIFGACFGVSWVILWWKFGIPLLSIYLSFILAGVILFSTICYSGLGDLNWLNNDINYWLILVCFVLLLSLIFTPLAVYGHILSCTIVGSYCMIVALNYYIGGNFQYIIINTFRRVVVKNFGYAVIDPPYQVADIGFTVVWIFLVIFGSYIQSRLQLNKPPFPCNKYRPAPNFATEEFSETSPLLHSQEFLPPPAYV